jgi:predicted DNA-binding transcriptional regulator YafY
MSAPRWKRQQWTVARVAALLAAGSRPQDGRLPSLAQIKKRFGIGLREMLHLNRRLGLNEDLSGATPLKLELQFDQGQVRAIGADRLSQLTRLTRVQAAFVSQAFDALACESALRPFLTRLSTRLRSAAGDVSDQLLIFRPSDPAPLRAKLSLLTQALRAQHSVAFEYRGPSSKSAGRVADPLSLRRDQGVWRVLCWDHQRLALRTFTLGHLTKLVVTAKRFEWQPHLKPETLKSRDLSVYEPNGKETAVKLRIGPKVAEEWKAVFTKLGKADKKGYRDATVMAGNAGWVLKTFLPLADEVRVLRPEAIRKMWRDELRLIAGNHSI